MLHQLIIIILIVNASASSNIMISNRIHGGKAVKILNVPYQVAVIQGDDLCGGSIITKNHVLTAAHCVPRSTNTVVTVGTNRIETGKMIVVAKIIRHPKFDPYTLQHDIAILKLRHSVNFGKNIRKINLPEPSAKLPEGANATISGWGTTEDGVSPKLLRSAVVPLVSYKTCKEYFRKIDRNFILPGMICAGFYGTAGIDTCQGDSGGPLVYDDVQYGITSKGLECGHPEKIGVYTDVRYYRGNFINQHIKSLKLKQNKHLD